VNILLFLALLFNCVIASAGLATAASSVPASKNQHLIFGKGTPQELEVYKIFGRIGGPTVMILGGIHGNEPGAYLSADLYTNVKLKRGNLIIVPRANFRSILDNQRGSGGDMNRKFAETPLSDPEKSIVDILKSLMAESDALLTLHDGSGFFRPEWVSPALNPHRYGQSIIADAATYTSPASGKTIPLQHYAEQVLREVNKEITDPQQAFHFLNMRTASENSLYKEHRKSATYYALMELGIPAFCIETSHNLPNLESKVYQHNMVVNAFLNLFGVAIEQPAVSLGTPTLSYLIVLVNKTLPLAVPNGQTLLVASGASVEIADVRANYERGLVIDVQGLSAFNPLRTPFIITQKTTVSVRKDTFPLGHINIEPRLRGEAFPRIAGSARIIPLYEPTPAALPPGPASALHAGASSITPESRQQSTKATDARAKTDGADGAEQPLSSPITGFLLEVDGRSVEVTPGSTLAIAAGSKIRLIDVTTNGAPLPEGVSMKLVDAVPKGAQRDTHDDRGRVVDTAGMLPAPHSAKNKGEAYAIRAEQEGRTLASCTLHVVQPKLASVTLRFRGSTKTVGVGKRINIPSGAPVEILGVAFAGGISPSNLRLTLGGHAVAPTLPQSCVMRNIALNLAVFNGDILAGKVTWAP